MVRRKANIVLIISLTFLVLPWVSQILLFDKSPPGIYDPTSGWIFFPWFYWISMTLFFIDILIRIVCKKKFLPFIAAFLLFAYQSFFAFEIKGALLPVVIFAIAYPLINLFRRQP